MLLTAAIIVKDEAAALDGCLTSLRGLVDEIVVVDTGSTDASAAVAERHRAVVAHLAWRDDFSLARNAALDLATGDWILYVDADEQVRPGDVGAARAALATDVGTIAGRVPFVPRVGWTPYRELRLWRHRPDIRFRGSMHESIVPAVAAVAESEHLRVEPFDLITIDHYGYEGDQTAKHARDEPMLLAEIERRPERVYLYDHLARIHEARGEDDRAVATWRRGLEVARGRGSKEADDVLVYVSLSCHLLAREAVDGELAEVLLEGLELFPLTPSLELAAARFEFATGAPAAAARRAAWLTALRPEEVLATGCSYDERIFGEWAWDLLGLCRLALDDPQGAAGAFLAAEAAAPGIQAYRVHRMLAEGRRARSRDEP